MQKLLIVQLRNSRIFSTEEFYADGSNILMDDNNSFYPDLLRRGRSWLSGNIFLGPRNRGPLTQNFIPVHVRFQILSLMSDRSLVLYIIFF